ncbi:MAG TPA: V-type ATP synthase subunit K [Clostridia bacterium]|jgi:V/A-type H+-transporting ATPase subunit K|nr:V-type ATP synthase subunit K [Clostridia bacterium]HQA97962.1 V-type ATP synthase subunit K [Clostridia bacterium]HQO55890.1 V-type ATP synthase subunit K [Clostridia bacterium]HUM60678.1 V-type ATP synthase subunit K [Clostridia bacterium]
MLSIGQILAFAAAALSTLIAGYGSAKAVGLAGQTSAGVSSENPEVNSKLMVLQILPGTQGIYGFLIAVIILVNTGALSGNLKDVDLLQGVMLLVAILPVVVVGYLSAIHQAKVASAGMLMVGQHPDMSGKAITMTVMVETYAVLALLASFLMVNAVKL